MQLNEQKLKTFCDLFVTTPTHLKTSEELAAFLRRAIDLVCDSAIDAVAPPIYLSPGSAFQFPNTQLPTASPFPSYMRPLTVCANRSYETLTTKDDPAGIGAMTQADGQGDDSGTRGD